MNYFELFEIPETLTPDVSNIKNRFYELSRKYHPDFYTQSSEAEQADILEKAALLNKAYKVFQNKDALIKYVLIEKGLLVEEEKYALPPEFLMEVMEHNEALMEAKIITDNSAMDKVNADIQKLQFDIYEPVKSIIDNYTQQKTTTEDLLKVKQYYFQKKYLDRILAAMH